jgi:hypothetical protein
MPSDQPPPIWWVRLKFVGLTRRVTHAVPIPPYGFPETLTAYCGQSIGQGEAEIVEPLTGQPCNGCLLFLPLPPEPLQLSGAETCNDAQCYLALGNLDTAHHYAEESVNTWNSDDRRESTKAADHPRHRVRRRRRTRCRQSDDRSPRRNPSPPLVARPRPTRTARSRTSLPATRAHIPTSRTARTQYGVRPNG